MSNIATKLTYLNGTKQAIKEAINEDFEVINDNTTFRQYAEKISNNNEKYKSFIPTKTVNATNTVDISDGVDMKALVNQYGNTYQKSTTGKNMFDISKVITSNRVVNNGDGTLTITTPSGSSASSASTPNKLSDYCPTLQVGDTVYINATTTGTDKQIYLGTSSFFWQFGTQRTITQNDLDSIVYWYASGISTSATISNIMVRKSTETEEYEEYTGGTASPNPDYPQDIVNISGETTVNITQGTEEKEYKINLPFELCKIGNYKDKLYNQNGKWYLHKEIGKVVYDGTETNWNRFEIGSNIIQYYIDLNTKHNANIPLAKSNYFRSGVLSHRGAGYENSVYTYSGGIAFNPNSFPTLEDWKTWLSTHNTEVYYVLATPTTEEITESNYPTLYNQLNAIKLFEGTNHITITNESGLDVEFDIEYHYNVDEVLKTLTTVEEE